MLAMLFLPARFFPLQFPSRWLAQVTSGSASFVAMYLSREYVMARGL